MLAFEVSLEKHVGGMPWITANTHSALSFSAIFLHVFGACLCILVHFLTFKIVIYSNEAIVDYGIIFCQKSLCFLCILLLFCEYLSHWDSAIMLWIQLKSCS